MAEQSLKDKTVKGVAWSGIDNVAQFGVAFVVSIVLAHQYVFRASPNGYQNGQLARLNRELDSLYETIYNEWATITEEDYKVFGGQLQLLILTVKQLYDACRKLPKENGLKAETRKLAMNYSALYELNSDIVNFRIKLPKNEEMKQALLKLAEVDKYNGQASILQASNLLFCLGAATASLSNE